MGGYPVTAQPCVDAVIGDCSERTRRHRVTDSDRLRELTRREVHLPLQDLLNRVGERRCRPRLDGREEFRCARLADGALLGGEREPVERLVVDGLVVVVTHRSSRRTLEAP